MDPNCAICDGPPKNRCDCEFRTLVHAVEESEQRVLEPMYDEIRTWVTTQARAAIHRDFRAREARRKTAYERWLLDYGARAPRWQREEMAFSLQRAISEDWKAAVERYPEVLDYYYGEVKWSTRSGGEERRPGGGGGGGGSSRTSRRREVWQG
ncbi:uncharacterized protein LAJ45_07060 [Morchella importuna]|uniref:Uncharacterized protein n=1 Tax=Morchella conica CCBAS932 TaxID=1392247 RepID=A0A3N4KK91_9PEZI|nr:uncharacterized protein LAJ45_07060 [Morchella importuna]KAH8148717.1 hypothetical protein LAJ45_07060 [Morchella importuna]RPB10984.1 hypothetical protein P167DRAFT_606914 [Morchella conica CCBAS932]